MTPGLEYDPDYSIEFHGEIHYEDTQQRGILYHNTYESREEAERDLNQYINEIKGVAARNACDKVIRKYTTEKEKCGCGNERLYLDTLQTHYCPICGPNQPKAEHIEDAILDKAMEEDGLETVSNFEAEIQRKEAETKAKMRLASVLVPLGGLVALTTLTVSPFDAWGQSIVTSIIITIVCVSIAAASLKRFNPHV